MADNLQNTGGLKEIVDEQGFYDMLKLAKTIIYILVDWSGQERVSRSVVYKILNELEIPEIPVFKIDCSKQENRYIEDWLSKQSTPLQSLYSNGYGETLLVKYGQVVDYIKYPGEQGIEKTKIKIAHWLT